MRDVTMPSGAILKIGDAPFADCKELYQAVLEEAKSLSVKDDDEIGAQLIKDMLCIGFSSKKIDAALKKVMSRSLYNGVKISDDSWEPVEARQDYMQACIEIAKENLAPFVKSLYAELSQVLPMIRSDLASRLQTTES